MGTFTSRNSPSPPVEAVSSKPVPTFTALTLAPGTTAPVPSETVPTIEPYSTCAEAGAAELSTNAVVTTAIAHKLEACFIIRESSVQVFGRRARALNRQYF